MYHSAGNDQFAFHTFLLAPDTDLSTFTIGHTLYGQLIPLFTFLSCRISHIVKWALLRENLSSVFPTKQFQTRSQLQNS